MHFGEINNYVVRNKGAVNCWNEQTIHIYVTDLVSWYMKITDKAGVKRQSGALSTDLSFSIAGHLRMYYCAYTMATYLQFKVYVWLDPLYNFAGHLPANHPVAMI